jgi:hypothetical protein
MISNPVTLDVPAVQPVKTPHTIRMHERDATKSFDGALLYVAANAIGAIACYMLVVGELKRVQLAP